MNNRLQIALRSAAVNGIINLPAALSIAAHFDQDEATAVGLLKSSKQGAGLTLEKDIDQHLSKVEGRFFNEKAYDVTDRNGEQ
jgi:hypothetical protein